MMADILVGSFSMHGANFMAYPCPSNINKVSP